MHRIGAVRVSRELAVPQRDLVRWLEQMISDPSAAAEWRRHQAVIRRIVELKAETAARAVKIVLPAGLPSRCPREFLFSPGCLPSSSTASSSCSSGSSCWPACLPPGRNYLTASASLASGFRFLHPCLRERRFSQEGVELCADFPGAEDPQVIDSRLPHSHDLLEPTLTARCPSDPWLRCGKNARQTSLARPRSRWEHQEIWFYELVMSASQSWSSTWPREH